MKKRIGNDIIFTWHIYRKDGDTQTPESFEGKEVEVKLISPLKQPVTIEDVSIATGVVTFTFRGKHQVTLGNYVAILQENKGENGMVTLDVVSAVTLVPHSYMEEDGDEGDVIEAESVEQTSTISAGGGGGMVQQQADWAQMDDTAVDFIKHKPDVVSVGDDGVTMNKQFLCLLREAEGKIQRVVLNAPEQGDAYVGVLDNLEDTNILIYPHGIFFEKGGIYGGYLKTDPTNHPGRLLLDNKVLAYIDDLASLVDGGAYNSQTKEIELTHGNTVLARIDARAFVKDGMVDSVVIDNGYIVITFNTDAGKQDISLALTDIFNPANYYDKTAMDALLAGKQNTITDLPAIRSGAAAGATAVQPADLTPIDDRLGDVEYCLGDYLKETYVFNALNKPEVSTEPVYTTRALYTVVQAGGHFYNCKCRLSAGGQEIDALYIGVLNPYNKIYFTKSGKATIYMVLNAGLDVSSTSVIFSICDNNDNIVKSIKKNELSYNSSKICTPFICDVSAGYYITINYDDVYNHALWLGQIDFEITEVKQISTDVHANSNAITAIEQKIPSQASSSNQLADKDFVNSSIATATATYRGSYNLVSDLLLSVSATHAEIATALATAIQTADDNDYCYVQIPVADDTPTEIASVERYKYNGTAWEYEYTLNNSGFTAAQWAALNSGITSGLVAKLSALPTNNELTALLSGKANTADLAPVATSGSYNDLSGKPTIPTVPSNVSAFNNDAGYITEKEVDDVPTANSNNPVKSGGVYGTTPSVTDTDAESDLDISDEDGNVLMRLAGGHIKTKNFDSQKKNVKISYLSIGNSVNQDVAAYLPYLLKSIYGNDIDFEIGIAFIGSYTIKDYVEQVITNNRKIEKFSYAKNTDVLTNYDDALYLEDLLSLKDWNIISFQMYQANTSGTGRTEDVTLAPQLLQYLKQHCISSCKFGLITPATYTDVRNLYMQWQQTILTSCSLDFIFDYGATKEFLINRGIPSNMLSTDGYHSNEGYPCITIALTAIHGIASIFNLENKASNFKDRMTYAKYQTLNIPNPNGDFQTATEEQWYIGINSAIDGSRVSKSAYNISNDSLRLQTFNN